MNKKAVLFFLCLFPSVFSYCQNTDEIISEMKNLFRTYNLTIGATGIQLTSLDIQYSAPFIYIHTTGKDDAYKHLSNDGSIRFDILKASFDIKDGYRFDKSMVIQCENGIETTWNNKNFLHSSYSISSHSEAVIRRLINAFKSLKQNAKEASVQKSSPHMFDDAELVVQKISFIAPDNSNKLKANQTGCIRVEIKNTESNHALEVACIVNEKTKSEMFSYDQYTSIEKINGNEAEVVNIPIKASENIDNTNYQFDIKVVYNGKTIKSQNVTIMGVNPRKAVVNNGKGYKTVKMRKMAGNTYLISCKVNGLPLDFIFDTGASSVTLSRKQAIFMLKNGYLSKSDLVGSSAYQTASGDIAIGTVIKLKKIDINGLILNNVEASIINSDSAPLLLGQSALSRLGKIQIDYKNSTLTIIR